MGGLQILIPLYQETRHLISAATGKSSSEELTLKQATRPALGTCVDLASKGSRQHLLHVKSIYKEPRHHKVSADRSWGGGAIHFLAASRPA